ncbi:type IV secretion system protein (plasmid) [Polaromonas sp. P1-6]|nr:type IV secretion system protein [Polaromonas sp. P1-6]
MVTAALLQMFPVILNDIIGLGNYVAASISGSGTAGGALGKAAHDFIAAFLAKFVDVVVKSIQNMGTGVLDFFSAPMDMVASLFFLVVACYFAFGALLELVGVVLVGPVVIGIAVALSPLFIATLASHWTRRWFDQWFNFLINGAMLTAMVVLVLTLLTGVVAATIGTTATSFQVGEALGLALLAAGMGKIFAAIPSFADALLPGRTSAGAALNSREKLRTIYARRKVWKLGDIGCDQCGGFCRNGGYSSCFGNACWSAGFPCRKSGADFFWWNRDAGRSWNDGEGGRDGWPWGKQCRRDRRAGQYECCTSN